MVKRHHVPPTPWHTERHVNDPGIRLVLLLLPLLAGFLTYYVMLSTTGLLCALIALTASLFCLPGEERLRRELHIEREGGEA